MSNNDKYAIIAVVIANSNHQLLISCITNRFQTNLEHLN